MATQTGDSEKPSWFHSSVKDFFSLKCYSPNNMYLVGTWRTALDYISFCPLERHSKRLQVDTGFIQAHVLFVLLPTLDSST